LAVYGPDDRESSRQQKGRGIRKRRRQEPTTCLDTWFVPSSSGGPVLPPLGWAGNETGETLPRSATPNRLVLGIHRGYDRKRSCLLPGWPGSECLLSESDTHRRTARARRKSRGMAPGTAWCADRQYVSKEDVEVRTGTGFDPTAKKTDRAGKLLEAPTPPGSTKHWPRGANPGPLEKNVARSPEEW